MKKIKINKKQNKVFKFLKNHWIFALILVFFLFFLYLTNSNKLLLWDEPVYLGNAASHIRDSNFTEDFRFPLLEYFISFIWLIFGESVLSAQILMILFSLGTIYIFYLLSKKFFDDEFTAFASTLAFSLTSQFIFWSFRIYTDIPSLFFTLLCFYFILNNKNKNSAYFNFFLAGISAGLAFLMRFVFVIPLIIWFYLLIKKEKENIKNLISFTLGGIISILPWLVFNTIKHKNPLWDLLEQTKAIGEYTSWQNPSLFFLNLFLIVGLSLFFLIPYFIDLIKKTKNKKIDSQEMLLVLFLIGSSLFYLFVIKLKLIRYSLALIPFVILAIFLGLNYITKKENTDNKKILKILLIAFVLSSILIPSLIQVNELRNKSYCEDKGAVINSIDYVKNITSDGQIVSSNSWPWYGYYGNLKATSIWTENIETLLSETQTTLIILVENGGLEVNKTNFENNSNLIKVQTFEDKCGQKVEIYEVIY